MVVFKETKHVESSTYSSEYIALKTAMEQILALWYKLCMFGIPLEGAACIFCYNESVHKSSSDPSV